MPVKKSVFTTKHYRELAKFVAIQLNSNYPDSSLQYRLANFLKNDNPSFNEGLFHNAISIALMDLRLAPNEKE